MQAFVEVDVVSVEDGVKNKRTIKGLTYLVFAAALVLSTACGTSSSQGINQPSNPSGGGGGSIPTTPPVDPRLPAWLAEAVEITLPTCSGNTTICSNGVNISGLIDIASNVLTPLVYTRFALSLDSGRNSSARGTIHVGFEDGYGFWGADLNSVEGASSFTGGSLDMIFSDSELTLRLVGNVVNDAFQAASVYYRVRQSGENQCQQVSYTCTVDYHDGRGPIESTACPSTPPTSLDTTACKNYMNLGVAKRLGGISGSFSKWIQ